MEKKEEDFKPEFRNANIGLILNSYNDLFSGFDARKSYSEKALSDDFISECRKAAKDKQEGFELVLFVPKQSRNLEEEFKMKKRLREHFYKHFFEKEKNIQMTRRRGFKWIFTGTLLVIIAIIIGTFKQSALVDSIVEPIFVIPGWFTIWVGLTKLLLDTEDQFPDFEFYKKMAKCKIIFRSY